jgi:hypothetical protein
MRQTLSGWLAADPHKHSFCGYDTILKNSCCKPKRAGYSTCVMTKNRINKAIRHLNLEIVGNGDRYFYFCDLTTGAQIGESVLVCYLKHQTLQRWVEDAQEARDSNIVSGVNLNQYEAFNTGNIN